MDQTNLNAYLSICELSARFLEIARDAAKDGGNEFFSREVATKAMDMSEHLMHAIGMED